MALQIAQRIPTLFYYSLIGLSPLYGMASMRVREYTDYSPDQRLLSELFNNELYGYEEYQDPLEEPCKTYCSLLEKKIFIPFFSVVGPMEYTTNTCEKSRYDSTLSYLEPQLQWYTCRLCAREFNSNVGCIRHLKKIHNQRTHFKYYYLKR